MGRASQGEAKGPERGRVEKGKREGGRKGGRTLWCLFPNTSPSEFICTGSARTEPGV